MKISPTNFSIVTIGIFLIPQIVFAAWWNPASWAVWKIFRYTSRVQERQLELDSAVQATATVEVVSTASTTKPAKQVEVKIKAEDSKDDKDLIIKSLKKQVEDLTQKTVQPQAETPKTSVITLPNGAVVEMDANGNITRTVTEAPQRVYELPAISNQVLKPEVSQPIPVTRTLEVFLKPNGSETHSRVGLAVERFPLFPFVFKAGGNADTHVSKIKFRTAGPTRFTEMWIESDDGLYVSNKVSASVFSGGYASIPVSITLMPNVTFGFAVYIRVPVGAASSSGVEYLQMEGITSDAGSISDLPLVGNTSLWYDR